MKSFILASVCMWQVLSVFSQSVTPLGDVVAGRSFTLKCKITRPTGNRSPLFWDRKLDDNQSRIYFSRECNSSIPVSTGSPAGLSGGCQHVSGEEVYTVTIENVTEDAGRGSWLCQYGRMTANVILDVKVMVTRVTLTNPPDAVIAGDPITFTCVTSTSKPPACVRGYIRNSGNVREIDPPVNCSQDSSSVQTTARTLTFTPSAEGNETHVYCNASNSVTHPPVRSQLHKLNVQYPPQSGVRLSGYVNNTAVESGETLALTCQVGKGNPTPVLSWSPGCGQINTVPGNDGSPQIIISITASPSLNQKTCVCKGSQGGALTKWTEQKNRTFSVLFGPDSVQLLVNISLPGDSVIATENNTVTFTCNSSESYPAAALSWYNNNSPIATAEVSQVSSQRGPNHGYLTKQRYTVRADRYQDGDVIRCEAQRSGWVTRGSPNLTLGVTYGPMFTSCKSSYIFVENVTAELSCTIWAKPEPRINWSRGVQSTRTSVTNHRYTSVVRFNKISRTDSGGYTVTANNNVTSGVERTVNVTVYYPPTVSVVLASGNVTEGNPLQLECRAEAVPPNYTYSTWSRIIGDRPVPLANHSPGKSLFISQVTFRDQGVYRCGASNGFGGVQGGQLEVKVRARPQFPNQISLQAAALGESVKLMIKFVSHPPYVNIKWYKLTNDTAERLAVRNTTKSKYRQHVREAEHEFLFYNTKVLLPGHVVELEISDVNRDDFGDYKFIVENDIGSSAFSVSLNLIDRPCPPNLTSPLCTKHDANVTWISCFDGGSTQTFKLQYKKEGGSWAVLNDSIPDPGEGMVVSHVVGGLTEGTNYSFRVYGRNRWNKSDTVETNCSVSAVRTGNPSSLAASVAGGVSGGIVMLGVSLAGVVILRRRKSENCSSGEKEAPPNHQEMAENPNMAAPVYQTLNLSPSSPEVPVYVNEVPIPEYENTFDTTTENDPSDTAYERLRTMLDTNRLYENTRSLTD